jgi:hypothetical protein
VPHVPKRPSSLVHLNDEAASIALARHYGDFAKAAKELGVARPDLRKLVWHNPRILRATHERMQLFNWNVRAKIVAALDSPIARRREWACDVMMDGDDGWL